MVTVEEGEREQERESDVCVLSISTIFTKLQ